MNIRIAGEDKENYHIDLTFSLVLVCLKNLGVTSFSKELVYCQFICNSRFTIHPQVKQVLFRISISMLTKLNSNLTQNIISLFFTLILPKRDFFVNLIGNVVFDEDISLCFICV